MPPVVLRGKVLDATYYLFHLVFLKYNNDDQAKRKVYRASITFFNLD